MVVLLFGPNSLICFALYSARARRCVFECYCKLPYTICRKAIFRQLEPTPFIVDDGFIVDGDAKRSCFIEKDGFDLEKGKRRMTW